MSLETQGNQMLPRASLQTLEGGTFDLLVIGGGIVGAGVARDAAMRGLKIALVDQNDFAFGTSSRSSRLLHGGLRYLAQGRVGLVREASVEKTILHRIAPHLAVPLPFVFPTYTDNRNWKLWQLKIGVKIYDLLCSGRNLGKSTWLDASEVLERFPGLVADELRGAVRYYDGFTNDARLVFDTLRSASKSGATVVNYCRFTDAGRARPAASTDDAELWNCKVEDKLTGKSLHVRARAIANATGPWADGLPHSRVKLRVTKGIHIVVDSAKISVSETVVMTQGKRILFAIPWGERTIIGTTDTDYSEMPEAVSVDASDIDYVLTIANKFFPKAKLNGTDVVSSWAGLRPLLADPNGKPSDISRSHEIKNPEPGWWDVAGGKLTTYRLMAEQTVDGIVNWLNQLKKSKQSIPSCRTAEELLLPAIETQNISGILPPEFCRRVVEHYCAGEWAVHLDDVMIRRTSWHHYFRDASAKSEHVANWMGELLGWTESQRAAELTRYHEIASCRPSQKNSTSVSIAR